MRIQPYVIPETSGEHIEEKLYRLRGAFHALKKIVSTLVIVGGETGGEMQGLEVTHDGLSVIIDQLARGEAERSVSHLAHPDIFAYGASATFGDVQESVQESVRKFRELQDKRDVSQAEQEPLMPDPEPAARTEPKGAIAPEGCEVHNNDSLWDEIDLPQQADDLFCKSGMSARTYCSAYSLDVGLPAGFALMFAMRDESAMKLAKSLLVMFLVHLQDEHKYRGTLVKVRFFSGTHLSFADKTAMATAGTTLDSLADTTAEFTIEFH